MDFKTIQLLHDKKQLTGEEFVKMWQQLDYNKMTRTDLNELEVNFLQRAIYDDFSKYIEKYQILSKHQSKMKKLRN